MRFDTFRQNKMQRRFYGENISDRMSILWRNSEKGGRRVNDFSSGNKGTLWVKQDKDLWRERDLILPESPAKIVHNGENETRVGKLVIELNQSKYHSLWPIQINSPSPLQSG